MSEFELDPHLRADTLPVIELPLSSVRLMNDARYPWLVLVPRRAGVTELVDLSPGDQRALVSEISRASSVLRELEHPDKLNVAALGNIVAQLHVHVVARFRRDEAWPAPPFGIGEPRSYTEEGARAYVERLARALA